MRLALALSLLTLGGCADALDALRPGVADGREGVRLLDAGDAEAAEGAFIAGLATDGTPRGVAARLWHGVGVARIRQQTPAEADSAFAEALARADDPAHRARYAYDAGTAALLGGDAARAVGLLRRSLVLYPANPDARRNYAIARRLLGDDETPEPSDFARQVKARADSLVAARQYPAALDVMEAGLDQDSTVAVYADFIGRLGGVAQIEQSVPPAPSVDSRP